MIYIFIGKEINVNWKNTEHKIAFLASTVIRMGFLYLNYKNNNIIPIGQVHSFKYHIIQDEASDKIECENIQPNLD